MADNNEIVIIGSGIIGATLAYWLVDKGVKVTLIEGNTIGAAPGTASWASAGLLSPASRPDTPAPILAMMQRSLELYPTLIARLQTEVPAATTGYTELDQLSLAANPDEAANLQKRLEWYHSAKVEPRAQWLTPQEVAEVEPLAGPNAGAIRHPAAIVRAAWLTQALVQAALLKGLTLRPGVLVSQLLVESERVQGVSLHGGERIKTEKVILAAGAWSGQWLDTTLAELGLAAPHLGYADQIFPVRGQMLSVQQPAKPLRHLLAGLGGYAFPRGDGSVAFGATVEPQAGFEVAVTPAGLRELWHLVHQLTPALENAAVRDTWAGLRPGSRADLPFLGPLPQLPDLWLACGHYRNGVTLAPATAELLTTALLDGSNQSVARLQNFSISNF